MALRRVRAGARRAVDRVLGRSGLELVVNSPTERLEPEFLELYERCAPFTMTYRERMYALWSAVNHVDAAGVPGDVVECGVWRGGSSMLAALTLERRGDAERRLWLYDTFEGMPEPSARDRDPEGAAAHAEWERSQAEGHNEWCYSPLEDVQANMRSTGLAEERVVFVPGKVEETLLATRPERIAILRLDTDWYDSTYAELVHLYPLLSPGGVLLLDDYGHWAGAREAVDRYLAEQGINLLLNRIDYTGRIAVKPGAAS